MNFKKIIKDEKKIFLSLFVISKLFFKLNFIIFLDFSGWEEPKKYKILIKRWKKLTKDKKKLEKKQTHIQPSHLSFKVFKFMVVTI